MGAVCEGFIAFSLGTLAPSDPFNLLDYNILQLDCVLLYEPKG